MGLFRALNAFDTFLVHVNFVRSIIYSQIYSMNENLDKLSSNVTPKEATGHTRHVSSAQGSSTSLSQYNSSRPSRGRPKRPDGNEQTSSSSGGGGALTAVPIGPSSQSHSRSGGPSIAGTGSAQTGTGTKRGNPVSSSSRRNKVFKSRAPMRGMEKCLTSQSVSQLSHFGVVYRVGDVVSLLHEDETLVYAQIRALVVDCYGEKSVGLTWLIPTPEFHTRGMNTFDPRLFTLGPEDEDLWEIETVHLVARCPVDFYHPLIPSQENSLTSTRVM